MKLISPSVFQPSPNIVAFFTEANRETVNPDGAIPGLNLGNNTDVPSLETETNLSDLFRETGLDRGRLATARQVHGTRVRLVNRPGIFAGTDGLITNTPGLLLGIQVADCAAVLLADSKNQVIGAVHAGWKGAAGGILPSAISEMNKLGTRTETLSVYISPCISMKNFEVGEEVARRFPDSFVNRVNFRKPHVDLKSFLENQLLKAGVRRKQIEISQECTVENSRFYSYRREKEKAGRMLALIALKS